MSTYIIERMPDRFGGQQQAFVDASNAIVKNATGLFRSAEQSNQNITQLFFDTLASFGADRGSIAHRLGTEDAENFGVERNGVNDFLASTFLGGPPYEEYNERIRSRMQEQLKTMDYDLYEFKQTKSQAYFDRFLGRRSMIEYSIVKGEELRTWPNLMDQGAFQRICALAEISPEGMDGYKDFVGNIDAMRKLKDKSPQDYRWVRLGTFISLIRKEHPEGKKSDWVLVTLRSVINGKMQPLSELFTWTFRDYVEDPVDRISLSGVSVLHQEAFLMDMMLDDLAKIFKNAIEWNGKNLKDLKDQVALFRYEFSHAMPFIRGSSAVGEWFEKSIYAAHGMKVAYNPKKMVDLEALTSSLKEFADNYDSMITLTKMEENSSESRVEL